MTTTNKGKPTKSELALLTEMFVRDEMRRVRELNAKNHGTDGNNPRLQARELALQRVLDFIIQNKRS
jgi:hypothetical protein